MIVLRIAVIAECGNGQRAASGWRDRAAGLWLQTRHAPCPAQFAYRHRRQCRAQGI